MTGANNKLTLEEAAHGHMKAIDRSDRYLININALVYLIESDTFIRDIDKLRTELKIPELKPSKDLNQVKIVLLPHRPAINSSYISNLSVDEVNRIEKNIYRKILCKYKLNSDFYLQVEWILLYGSFLPLNLIELNHGMFQWYIKYPVEFVRNPHTTSDILFMNRSARLELGLYGKITTSEKELLKSIKSLLKFNKNKERRPRDAKNIAFYIAAVKKHGQPYADNIADNIITTYADIVFEKLDDGTSVFPDKQKSDLEREKTIKALKSVNNHLKRYEIN